MRAIQSSFLIGWFVFLEQALFYVEPNVLNACVLTLFTRVCEVPR